MKKFVAVVVAAVGLGAVSHAGAVRFVGAHVVKPVVKGGVKVAKAGARGAAKAGHAVAKAAY